MRRGRFRKEPAWHREVRQRLREDEQRERDQLLGLRHRPVALRREGVRGRAPAARQGHQGAAGGVALSVGGGVGNES